MAVGRLAGFCVGGGLRFSSGDDLRSGDVRWDQGGDTTVSAQVGYRFDRPLEATLTIDNLFDRKHYEKLGGAARQNDSGQPRGVMLNVRYQY